MPFSVLPAENDRFIHAVFEGFIPINEFERAREACLHLDNQLGWNKILADVRKTTSKLSITELYNLICSLVFKLPLGICIAVLTIPEGTLETGFVETVATNHGVSLRVFADPAEAIAWLHHP